MNQNNPINAHWLVMVLLSCVALLQTGCPQAASTSLVYNVDNMKEIREEFQLGGSGGVAASAGPAVPPRDNPLWTDVTFKFQVEGEVVQLSPISTPKQKDICGAVYANQIFEVSSSGQFKNVLVFLDMSLPSDPASGWVHEQYDFDWVDANVTGDKLPQQLREVEFDQEKCVFEHRMFAMRTNQIMKILNSDPVPHNTNMSPKKNPGANPTVGPNSSVNYTPDKEGENFKAELAPFAIACSIHPWMLSYGIFRDNPYFGVTNKNGEVTIQKVPAGVPLKFAVWQESLKWVAPSKVEGATDKWKRGKFEVTLPEGDSHIITVSIDGSLLKAS